MGKKKTKIYILSPPPIQPTQTSPKKTYTSPLRSPAAQVMEGAIFDSFRSLGLSACNLNNDQLLEVPAQYNNSTAVMVPPSDRFFVSPSTSGSLAAWDCNCNAPLQEDEVELRVPPSYHRFFVSPSSSGLISSTLDHPVVKSSVMAVSPFPSSSNSISSDNESVLASSSSALELDGTSSSSSYAPALLINIPGDGIAVSTDSDDPYRDFKQSMQEMLAHHRFQALDWDLLEELLFCYLELNSRSMHRFIIMAFADVVAAALRPPHHQLERSIDGEEDQVI